MRSYILVLLIAIAIPVFAQNNATISEEVQTFSTYPFSDPNPIPDPESSFYPYFRFDGFAQKPDDKEWKVVELENDYIKLSVFPEIGGKIWGAIEKSTGNEFIYYNSVVKFRDIAMRGAWVSGGIELNFGVIGHAPTSATPVDYKLIENEDGSVSCFVGATELLTRTRWETEINLPKDKAYFTTKTTWHNPRPLVQPYYQWMNAAYQIDGDLEFCFPGDHWIGHDGSAHHWPIDPEGRDVSWYKNNSFGGSKSNHVLGGISDHYAGYWHDLDFGSGHYSPYGEKLGMKVFQWAHSRSGGIWEDLLTDTDGQYVEMQSGRLFNQATAQSTKTPFKHHGFEPYATDEFKEYWFPILNTKGVEQANPYGIVNVEKTDDGHVVYFCPLQKIEDQISIYAGDKLIEQIDINLDVLETWTMHIKSIDSDAFLKVVLGINKLVYSEKPEDNQLHRPMEAPTDFDWNSAYGLFLDGQQWIYLNKFVQAYNSFEKCLEKDPNYAPALNQLAALCYRKADYQKGLDYATKSLSINTYDVEANFYYGLNNKRLGNLLDAQDGFSVASLTPSYRNASHIELAKLKLMKGDVLSAKGYAAKILDSNPHDLEGNKLMALISRKLGKSNDKYLQRIESIARLNHFVDFERWVLKRDEASKNAFLQGIKSELPQETFMEMALWYQDAGGDEEAMELLAFSPPNALAYLQMAYLQEENSNDSKKYLGQAMQQTPDFVFPFRPENLKVLNWANGQTDNWKATYYLALLQWRLDHLEEAKALFAQCGTTPDYAPFYSAKSILFGKEDHYDPKQDLLQANKLNPNDWRNAANLIDYYLSLNQPKDALEMATSALKKFPDNSVLKYNYAKCLLADGQYSACKKALAKTTILPSEGARYGRLTYRQACVMESLAFYKNGKYSSAINSIEDAYLWPENLGVGKPYVVDERIEDYLEAASWLKRGKKEQAEVLFQKVIDYTKEIKPRFGSVDYLYLLSLEELKKASEIHEYLEQWKNEEPNDNVQKWCNAMIQNDNEQAQQLESQINTQTGGTPWDPHNADPEFEIVKSIARSMKK